jgi:undecaprenyl-diphosphatase
VKKYLFVLFCVVFFGQAVYSESVYTGDLKNESIMGVISLGVFFPSLCMDAAPGDTITKDAINAFDRGTMFPYNKHLDDISTWSAYGALIMPGLSVLGNITEYRTLVTYGIMYAEAFLLTYGTKDMLKFTIPRNRPYTYFNSIPAGEEQDYYNSFPSGHTSFAFLGATFLSVTFANEYPESKWKLPVIIGSYTVAAGIAAMRIASGNHFITDVLTSAAIGSLYGWLIPQLHIKPKNPQIDNVAVNLIGNGIIVTVSLETADVRNTRTCLIFPTKAML